MTEDKKKRVPTSLRVIAEMYESAKENCLKAHCRVDSWGKPTMSMNNSPEERALMAAKDCVIDTLSKIIESEAVKKFGKEYGLIVVPLCHRSTTSSGEDRLHIDLKVKRFPGCEKEIKAAEEETRRFKDDLAKIEQWHMDALQAIAKKEELPALPDIAE